MTVQRQWLSGRARTSPTWPWLLRLRSTPLLSSRTASRDPGPPMERGHKRVSENHGASEYDNLQRYQIKAGREGGWRVEPQGASAGSRLLGRGVGVHASGVPGAVEVDVLPLGVLSVPDTSLLRLPCVWSARPVDVLHEPNVGNAGSVIP